MPVTELLITVAIAAVREILRSHGKPDGEIADDVAAMVARITKNEASLNQAIEEALGG